MAKRIGWLAILIGAACCLHACGDVENSTNGKPVASLQVTPAKVACGVGSSETFYAIPTYTDGTIGSYVHAAWNVTNSLGPLLGVGFAEILTPSVAGTGEVHAVFGSLTGIATVTVTGSPTPAPNGLTTIEVSPATLDMPVGATQSFTATGVDSLGNNIAFAPAWSLTGDAVGTFTFSGTTATLEATSTGTAVINCVSGEVVGTIPVTIEGHLVNLTVESNTYVDETNPTVTDEGQNVLEAGISLTNTHFNTYLHFSLAALPGDVTIESAVLQLYANSANSSSFQLYNLNSPFTAEVTTWNTRPPDGSSSSIQSTTFTAGQYNSINGSALLSTVQTWYSGPATNYGIAIRQASATSGTVEFLSKENGANPPVLTVIYK